MSKRNYKFGGNVHETVPASRQNIEQRTPSGVRPVSSPVVPVVGVSGKMRNGGEVKNMKKPKKMAFGGPAGPMPNGASNMPMSNMSPAPNPYPMSPMTGSMNQMGVMPRAPAMKKGGKVNASTYNDMTGGAGGGIGRLEKTSIASKTKSQKLKTGGKVKGYAGGKQVVADDDRSFGSVFADARRAKADEFEWRGKKYTTKLADGPTPKQAARKAMETPRNAGGGPRGNPSTGGEAQMRSMNLYPFGTDSSNVDTMRDEQYAKDNRGKSGGRGGRRRSPDGDMVGPMDARPAAGTGGGRGGKRRPNSTPIDGGVSFPIEKRGSSSGQSPSVPGGPLPNPPPDWKSGRRKERSFLERMFRVPTPEERDAAYDKVNESGLFGSRMYYNTGRMGEGVKGFGPDVKKRGGVAKMAKGGKVEKFEGSAEDMAQDKKLAKKRGMSLKAWEKSSADEKHDKQRNMKGLKKGGVTCGGMAMGGYASGGMSTAQDGMKGALRLKPSAMAMGGKVKRMFPGGRVPKEEPTYGDPSQLRRESEPDRYTALSNRKGNKERNPVKGMGSRLAGLSNMFPEKRTPSMSFDRKGRTVEDTARSVRASSPDKAQSASIMSDQRSQNEAMKGGFFDSPKRHLPPTSPKNREDPVGSNPAKTNRQTELFRIGPFVGEEELGVRTYRRDPKDPLGAMKMEPPKPKKPAKVKVGEPDETGMKKGGKACGGMAKYAMGGKVSTAQDGMKKPLRPKPTAMAKGGKVGMTFGKPLPGTKLSSQKIRATTATGASLKKDGMKGQLRAKASGAKPTNMMKPLGMTKMASGGKVRGAGCAQRGTKFIGEV
jgi:hypothetical protein